MNSSKREFANDVLIDLVKIANMLTKAADQFFRPYNITTAQYNALIILRNSSEKISQQQLSSQMVVSRSDITGIVDKIEKVGYVKRVSHKYDRRIKLLEITKKGLDLIKQVEDTYYERVEKITNDLSLADLKNLDQIIVKIKNSI